MNDLSKLTLEELLASILAEEDFAHAVATPDAKPERSGKVEECDGCRKNFPLSQIRFTGQQFLCSTCCFGQ
jgi:predicted nucleotide-binding protein